MTEQGSDLPPAPRTARPPPPLPPSAGGFQPAPIPVLPIAVEAVDRNFRPRPGILSAVAVISIVVASLSLIASLVSGCQAGFLYAVARTAVPPPPPPVAAPPVGGSSFSSGVVVTNVPGTPSAVTAPTQTNLNALTPAEVASILQKVQKATGSKMNPVQSRALTAALQNPNQTLVSPGTAWSPVRMAKANIDGSIVIHFTGGLVTLLPQGQLVNNPTPTLNISKRTCAWVVIDALLCVVLAIFLFVSGIFVTRNSPRGRKLHLIYAITKIPVAISSGAALALMYYEMFASSGAPQLQGMMAGYAIGVSAFGLIYPIALLITMNTTSVRVYYKPLQS